MVNREPVSVYCLLLSVSKVVINSNSFLFTSKDAPSSDARSPERSFLFLVAMPLLLRKKEMYIAHAQMAFGTRKQDLKLLGN